MEIRVAWIVVQSQASNAQVTPHHCSAYLIYLLVDDLLSLSLPNRISQNSF